MSIFIEIIILLIVLACMVMLLLGIRHLTHYEDFDDTEDTVNLRDEIESDNHIMSHNNIFSTLVEVDPEEDEKIKKRD